MTEAVNGRLVIGLHGSLSAPVTIGGIPHSAGIVNATVAAILCFGLHMPWVGAPLFALVHGALYWLCRHDPYALSILRRHVALAPLLEG